MTDTRCNDCPCLNDCPIVVDYNSIMCNYKRHLTRKTKGNIMTNKINNLITKYENNYKMRGAGYEPILYQKEVIQDLKELIGE